MKTPHKSNTMSFEDIKTQNGDRHHRWRSVHQGTPSVQAAAGALPLRYSYTASASNDSEALLVDLAPNPVLKVSHLLISRPR
jgi:hypothetical protein